MKKVFVIASALSFALFVFIFLRSNSEDPKPPEGSIEQRISETDHAFPPIVADADQKKTSLSTVENIPESATAKEDIEDFLGLLDQLEQTSAEEVEEEIPPISPEYLEIGMILDQNVDIPGAVYTDIALGNITLKYPTNLPEGYEAHAISWDDSGYVIILPEDGAEVRRIQLERNGITEDLSPEDGWRIQQENESMIENMERFPKESEEFRKLYEEWLQYREEHGTVSVRGWVFGGSKSTVIVVGIDYDTGELYSVANP